MARIITFILLLFSCYGYSQDGASAQDTTGVIPVLNKFSGKYINTVADKSESASKNIDRQATKYLDRFERQDMRLMKKLSKKVDSVTAKNMLANAQQQYRQEKERLANTTKKFSHYLPGLDTMITSMKFLGRYQPYLTQSRAIQAKLKAGFGKVDTLKGQLQKAEDLKAFLEERREYLKQQLAQAGLFSELKGVSKEYYYYTAQVQQITDGVMEPDKVEQQTLRLLNQTKIFQDFLHNNSYLASFFHIPGNSNVASSLTPLPGLQTTAQVSQLVQQQIGSAGADAMGQLQQNMQQAQTLLQQLKNKIGPSGGSSDAEMPDFKMNPQHVKSFLRRLELGTSLQSQRGSYYFPATTTVALSVAYRLSDKNDVGVGAGEIIGLGTGWNHIQFTQSGVNLRSFTDWRIKMSSLWLTGGYEMNYLSAFNSIEQLKQYNAWQRSGLIGLSKKYSVGKKWNGTLQLLWDFLSYSEQPRGQPFVFRTGFSLK